MTTPTDTPAEQQVPAPHTRHRRGRRTIAGIVALAIILLVVLLLQRLSNAPNPHRPTSPTSAPPAVGTTADAPPNNITTGGVSGTTSTGRPGPTASATGAPMTDSTGVRLQRFCSGENESTDNTGTLLWCSADPRGVVVEIFRAASTADLAVALHQTAALGCSGGLALVDSIDRWMLIGTPPDCTEPVPAAVSPRVARAVRPSLVAAQRVLGGQIVPVGR